jgi:hypothetical protein
VGSVLLYVVLLREGAPVAIPALLVALTMGGVIFQVVSFGRTSTLSFQSPSALLKQFRWGVLT